MTDSLIANPLDYMRAKLRVNVPDEAWLASFETWWQETGEALALQTIAPPVLENDALIHPPEWRQMVGHLFEMGAIWRAFIEETPLHSHALGYVTAFYDPALYSIFATSLTVMNVIDKYASADVRDRFVPYLTDQTSAAWTSTLWIGTPGDSDVSAHPVAGGWRMFGGRVGCVNAGADVALVVARPEGQTQPMPFIVPLRASDGNLNYHVLGFDDEGGAVVEFRNAEAYALGSSRESGEIIRESENMLRALEAWGAVGALQRAMVAAQNRGVEVGNIANLLHVSFSLMWETLGLAVWTWREVPILRSETYDAFELAGHVALYPLGMLMVTLTPMLSNPVQYYLPPGGLWKAWTSSDDRFLIAALGALATGRKALFAAFAPYLDADRVATLDTEIEESIEQYHLSADIGMRLLRDTGLMVARAADKKLNEAALSLS